MGKITFEGRTMQRFLQEAQTKPVICFGAGNFMALIDKAIIRPNKLKVKYLVANNRKRQGQSYLGYEVYAPEKLLEEPAGSFVVLISSGYAYEINEQLEAMGVQGAYPAVLFWEGLLRQAHITISLNVNYTEKGRN